MAGGRGMAGGGDMVLPAKGGLGVMVGGRDMAGGGGLVLPAKGGLGVMAGGGGRAGGEGALGGTPQPATVTGSLILPPLREHWSPTVLCGTARVSWVRLCVVLASGQALQA